MPRAQVEMFHFQEIISLKKSIFTVVGTLFIRFLRDEEEYLTLNQTSAGVLDC